MSEEYRMMFGRGLERFQSQRGLRDLEDLRVGVEVLVRVGWREVAGCLEKGRGRGRVWIIGILILEEWIAVVIGIVVYSSSQALCNYCNSSLLHIT